MDLYTIYLVCAVAGGTVLVLRVILMLVGLDQGDISGDIPADVGLDADLDTVDHPGGGIGETFNFLSLQSIAGFFTMFGLVGMGLLQIEASDFWSMVGALGAGALTAWATGMIFLSLRRLQSEGTLVISNAVGQQGTVYLTIPEQGTGVVNVSVQGSLRQFEAVSEKGRKIPTGAVVQVTGLTAGNILVVSEHSGGKPSTSESGA